MASSLGKKVCAPTFSDLIRTREVQQHRVRDNLHKQNQLLKQRLAECGVPSDTPLTSPDLTDPTNDSELPIALFEAANNGALRPQQTSSVPPEEFLRYVADLKEMISRSKESEATSLQEGVTAQTDLLLERFTDLEARVNEQSKKHELLREEHSSQLATLTMALESLQAENEAQQRQLNSKDELIMTLRTQLSSLEMSLHTLSSKVSDVDSLSNHGQTEMKDLLLAFFNFKTEFFKEKDLMYSKHREATEKQVDEFNSILEDAGAQLNSMKEATKDALAVALDAQSHVKNKVAEHVEPFQRSIDEKIQKAFERLELIGADLRQKQELAIENLVERGETLSHDMRCAAADTLDILKAEHVSKLNERLQALVRAADEHEQRRRAELPLLDADRMQLMEMELEGSFMMLEGIARNSVLKDVQSRGTAIDRRLEALEHQMEVILAKVSDFTPKVMFNVDTQTANDCCAISRVDWEVSGPIGSPVSALQRKEKSLTSKPLQFELDRATNDLSYRQLVGAVDHALFNSSDESRLRQIQNLSSPSGGNTRVVLAQLRATRRKKEETVEKLQTTLREIHTRVSEMSDKEKTIRERAAMSPRDSRQFSERLTRQKEMIFEKERQLVGERNQLLGEIAILVEEEKSLSIGA